MGKRARKAVRRVRQSQARNPLQKNPTRPQPALIVLQGERPHQRPEMQGRLYESS